MSFYQFMCSGSRRNAPDTLYTVTTYGPSLRVFPSLSLPSKSDKLFPSELKYVMKLGNRKIALESDTVYHLSNRTFCHITNPPIVEISQSKYFLVTGRIW